LKLLRDILYKAGLEAVHGNVQLAIEHLSSDSRKTERFGLYIAIKGTVQDGHRYISQAIANGAIAVVCEDMPETLLPNVTYVRVKSTEKALGQMAANFYEHPSTQLKLIGVTGTNGKTSVATTLYNLYTKMGYRCGLISTVIVKIGSTNIPATHTTPDAINLQHLLSQMVTHRISYCFMEVSSHALEQQRVNGCRFRGAIFTNLTHDHLDYHKTFDAYFRAKKKLFDMLPEDAFALTNTDDKHGEPIVSGTKAIVSDYALYKSATFKGKIIENTMEGLQLSFDGQDFSTLLSGKFNAGNLLACYGAAVLMGQEKMQVLTTLSTLSPVAGRFQKIRPNVSVPMGIVDYAHTPDALEKVLQTIREAQSEDSSILCVVGCGGDRDTSKRPLMGKIAASYARHAIFTSDNPRSENPIQIIEEMKRGLNPQLLANVISIPDRAEAIQLAVTLAKANDVILVAGKGHEAFQEINGHKTPFSDSEVLENLLTQKSKN
jgi:UDP-N-acetylmuramoyl-L-alanyl-D-glutamate--2,6-diaminopimelate ligase